jgi:hypothetical protein
MDVQTCSVVCVDPSVWKTSLNRQSVCGSCQENHSLSGMHARLAVFHELCCVHCTVTQSVPVEPCE